MKTADALNLLIALEERVARIYFRFFRAFREDPVAAECWWELARDEYGRAVGFCSFWRVLDELHINNLAVLPDLRRNGIASALLGHVLREGARLGAVRATLEVRRSNDPARLLYERFGFSIAGVRRGYYSNPVEDALILWRDGLETP